MNPRPFLTIDQLLERWSGAITRSTLAVWRTRNQGPEYIKVGSKVLYHLESVKDYESRQNQS